MKHRFVSTLSVANPEYNLARFSLDDNSSVYWSGFRLTKSAIRFSYRNKNVGNRASGKLFFH